MSDAEVGVVTQGAAAAGAEVPEIGIGMLGYAFMGKAHANAYKWWWPHGHIIGWEHTFIHEIHHLLQAIAGAGDIRPYGADFQDGYRAAEVCDAVVRSSQAGQREQITYRTLRP